MSTHLENEQNLEAVCPSCGVLSMFTKIGVQTWPDEVAKAMQLPVETALYCCGSCDTTINEVTLLGSHTA